MTYAILIAALKKHKIFKSKKAKKKIKKNLKENKWIVDFN